jgi:signal transduction histidine kinase
LVGALQQRLDTVERRANVETRLYTEGELGELPVDVEEHLFHIALEALNNTLRHAQATEVTVNLNADNGRLKMTVLDNGVGFDPAAPSLGLGLVTMQERVGSIGGTVSIRSTPQEGTTVEILVALKPDEQV